MKIFDVEFAKGELLKGILGGLAILTLSYMSLYFIIPLIKTWNM